MSPHPISPFDYRAEDARVERTFMLPDGRVVTTPAGRYGAFQAFVLPGVTHIEQPKNPHQRPA